MLGYTRDDERWWRTAALRGVSLLLGLSVALTLIVVFGRSAQAQPKPLEKKPVMLSLVRVFHCYPNYKSPACSKQLEDQANDWLQKAQPGVRIVGQQLSANQYAVYLSIMYEVRDWRVETPTSKKPAEATP